jgi:hypothetical protein
MIESSRYTVRVWFTSICISPIILQVIDYLTDAPHAAASFGQAVFMWCFIIVFSLFISVFTWLLFFACTYQLLKMDLPRRFFMPAVQVTGLLLALLTFFVFDSLIAFLEYPFWTFATCYLSTIAACMQLYKIPTSYRDRVIL